MSIQVEGLSHIYNPGLPYESTALDQVSFRVEDGEFIGIIGHTGSGKSTLVQHLNGLLKPSAGRIRIGETDITGEGASMKEIRRKIGLVFQYPEYQLFEETVLKDVAFGPQNLGLSQEEVRIRAEEALKLVGLDAGEIGDRSPFDLSGGQKRRVAIAGVIAMRPEVLILDEPTAGLDPKAHRDILGMISGIHREMGTITLLISHNMSDIAALSDRIFVMEKGRLVLEGKPEEVFAREDLLKTMGLGLPQVLEITLLLKEKGFPLKSGCILDMETASREIAEILLKKGQDLSGAGGRRDPEYGGQPQETL